MLVRIKYENSTGERLYSVVAIIITNSLRLDTIARSNMDLKEIKNRQCDTL